MSDAGTVQDAWDALDAGDPVRAAALAEALGPDELDTQLVLVHAALDLGRLDAARAALRNAESLCDGEDAQLDLARGELALATWDLAGARIAFERVLSIDEDPSTLDRLALTLEHQGDAARADDLRARAHALAPDAFPPVVHLDEDRFDAVVEATLASLPEATRTALANVRIVREPLPDLEFVPPDDPLSTPPDLIGVFVGANRLEASEDWIEHPPVIHLFQRNVERICADEAEVAEQVRVTLLHEIGHFLGLDEDGVHELGLG
jgi:predicted Zn-dependent protease with MMP-like domain